jgi:NhaA family Na+:H+ antiporter
VLLLSIAVLDDVFGIGLLALLSTGSLQLLPVAAALAVTAVTAWFGRHRAIPLVSLLALWAALLVLLFAGGIHPTLSGVLVALAAPSKRPSVAEPAYVRETGQASAAPQVAEPVGFAETAVERLELALLPWVSYLILPLFVLSHAGVTFDAANRTTVAAAVGLALGKPVALIGSLLLGAKLRLLSLGAGVGVREVVVIGHLCGGGLTVSSLLASAALSDAGPAILGVLIGTTLSIVAAVAAAMMPKRQ